MAQDFLAVAQIQIAANTKLFQEELAALLASTAKTPPIKIPVVIGTVGGAGAQTATKAAAASATKASEEVSRGAGITRGALEAEAAAAAKAAATVSQSAAATGAALEEEARLAQIAAASTQELAAAHESAVGINSAFVATEQAVAKARLKVVGAASAEQAAEIQLARQAAAGAAARELLTQAQLAGADVEKLLANSVVATAVAYGEEAAAAAAAAEATKIQAAAAKRAAVTTGEVTKGLQAQALSAAGLRGAIIGANSAFLAATAGAILLGKSIQLATSFQTELSVFNVTTGATADQMARVGDEARKLGKDVSLPGVSAGDAAVAMTELAKAGLSVQDSIAGARGVLQLATAANISNADATELAASALNAFGLAGDQAVHVADVLANAANDAQGSISDIGLALGQAATVGRQAGLTLEQTASVLTIFARNGLKGSDAGTAFRTAMLRLINPTDKAAKIIASLGLNVRTATGAINLNVFDQFTQATQNMTKAERDRDLAIIFGQDAIRGAAILARTGATAIDQQTDSLNKAGTAAAVAAARQVGLAGATANLKNQLEGLGLTLGTVATGPLTVFAQGVGDLAGFIQTDINLFGKLKKAAADAIPKVKLGPVDTTEGDKGITHFIKKHAGLVIAFQISPGAVGLALATKGIQAVNDNAAKAKVNLDSLIAGLAETQSVFGATSKNADALASVLVRFGQLFTQSATGVKALEKAFSDVSPKIKAALEDGVITPAERTAIGVDALGKAFLALHDIPVGTGLKATGAEIRSDIEDAAAQAHVGAIRIGPAIASGIEDGTRQATTAATSLTTDVAAALQAGLDSVFSTGLRTSRNQAGQAASEILDIQFRGGTPATQLPAFKALLADQTATVKLLEGRGAPQAKIDAAKKAAIATQQEIDSLQGQINSAQQDTINTAKAAAAKRKSDAQAAAAKIASDRAAADQAVIDSFTGRQNRLDIRATQVGATETLKDDLALQIAIANEASREIAIIDKTVKDQKARAAAIAQRVQTLAQTGVQIDSLRKQIAQGAKDRAAAAIQATTDLLGKRLQLAQLRGGKDAIVAAFDAAIANAKKQVAAAKKAGKGVVDAQIALQQFINDRKDFLKSVSKQADDVKSQGITAFDLLKESAAVFNQNAGNLINAQQPFVGPSGFSADIAQFLVRRPQSTPGSQNLGSPQEVKLSDDLLIRALDRLTDAVSGAGNGSTATPQTATGNPWAGGRWSRWFMDAASAKNAQEG